MFVGLEGVGLCSYLLIGFWYKKRAAADAGKKAFIVNRIGDAGFLLGMALLFSRFGTLDFAGLAREIASLAPETAAFGAVSAAALLLFVGATGKSAQLPLYVWLPDAMEGPTPVSALIHAATMVTAGVYMIGRNAVLYTHAPGVLEIVAVVGVVTALFAATIGLTQTDIKRVLAYSTVSQLGLMFLAMGVGAFSAGIFHLYTHAFFKALLFLGAGAVIHALAGEQDLRRMGGLRRHLPVTYWTFLIGALAIAGVPGLSGFFSKDEVLFRTFAAGHPLLWVLGAAASLLTAIYMFRLVFLAFHGGASQGASPQHAPHQHLHDAPPQMAVVLVALAAGAALAGYAGIPAALGGSNRIEAFLEPSFHAVAEPGPEGPFRAAAAALPQDGAGLPHDGEVPHDAHDTGLELGLMGVSTLIALGGIAVAALFFLWRRDLADAWAARYRGLHRLLLRKYYVDELYDAAIVQPVKAVSEQVLWKGVDAGLIDGAVNGAGLSIRGASASLRRLQTGSLRTYAASLFVGAVLVLGYLLWP
jgi:NADH-quinone oxidoreductase subunit L